MRPSVDTRRGWANQNTCRDGPFLEGAGMPLNSTPLPRPRRSAGPIASQGDQMANKSGADDDGIVARPARLRGLSSSLAPAPNCQTSPLRLPLSPDDITLPSCSWPSAAIEGSSCQLCFRTSARTATNNSDGLLLLLRAARSVPRPGGFRPTGFATAKPSDVCP
jgi:hypothetical protein